MKQFLPLAYRCAVIIIFIIILSPPLLLGQSVTTSSGGQQHTQANSAYVTPVITKVYTAQSDPYTWDNNKNTIRSNPSYTVPTGVSITPGGTFNFRIFGRPKWERRIIKETKKSAIIDNKNAQVAIITDSIMEDVAKLDQQYNSGNYFDALQTVRNIGASYNNLYRVRSELFAATGSVTIVDYPSEEATNAQNFYTLLTLNKVGRHAKVSSPKNSTF